MPHGDVARAGSPAIAPPCPSAPGFFLRCPRAVVMSLSAVETRVSHVYNRREEEVKQEERGHTPLTKALFYSEQHW